MCLSIVVDDPGRELSRGEHAGFEFVVTHNDNGYRCGYVRVPPDHPWHGKHYAAIEADVHGGLTFAEPDVACGKGGRDDAYWLGFDAAHAGDEPDPSLPGAKSLRDAARMAAGPMGDLLLVLADRSIGACDVPPGIRTQEYMEAECRKLCEQARDAALVTIG